MRSEPTPTPPRATVDTLTGKQRPFVEHYLTHFNATRAAQQAGYSNPDKAGPRNLKIPKIAEAIENALAHLVMTRNEALRLLSSQARAEYAKYFKVATPTSSADSGQQQIITFDLQTMLDEGKGHLIKSVKDTQWGQEITFYDAQTAVIWLGKHHKLFTDIIQSDRDAELDDALDRLNQQTAIDL